MIVTMIDASKTIVKQYKDNTAMVEMSFINKDGTVIVSMNRPNLNQHIKECQAFLEDLDAPNTHTRKCVDYDEFIDFIRDDCGPEVYVPSCREDLKKLFTELNVTFRKPCGKTFPQAIICKEGCPFCAIREIQ
jgi:hypothetical protein